MLWQPTFFVLCPVGLSSLAGPLFGAAGPDRYISWVEFQHTLVKCWVLLHMVKFGVNYACGGTMVVLLDGAWHQDIYCNNPQDFLALGATAHQTDRSLPCL